MTKPGDVDHYTRVRTYKALTARYYDQTALHWPSCCSPCAWPAPREALWHAIIRRNFGANHSSRRDHAGPGKDSSGNPFYGPYDAQDDIVMQYGDEIGVTMVLFRMLVHLPMKHATKRIDKVPNDADSLRFPHAGARGISPEAAKATDLVLRPEVAEILAETCHHAIGKGAASGLPA